MAQGGYRPPTSPAPVSGPGRLSRRTDGKQAVQTLPDADYGEQATFRQDQQGAPMAAAPGGADAQAMVSPADLSSIVPMGAPTANAGEPVTAGAAAGAGPGMEALGLDSAENDPGVQNLRRILPSLELMASLPTAGEAARAFVRRVRASM